MNTAKRLKKTTSELIALINQRHVDWWPTEFSLTINRSAEHDWIAIVGAQRLDLDENRKAEFARSLGVIVADLRLRYAWAGH